MVVCYADRSDSRNRSNGESNRVLVIDKQEEVEEENK